MNRTKIEYLDFTWNTHVGCSGFQCCVRDVCWARAMAKRRKNKCALCYSFLPHFHKERLYEPLHRKKPSRIGLCFSSDFFQSEIPFPEKAQVLDIIERCQQHTFLVLTKQAQNLLYSIPKNLWVGVSVNKKCDLWRIDDLAYMPYKSVKFVSFEPLYEDLKDVSLKGIDWIIIGAQTRPLLQPKEEWVVHLLNKAHKEGIPYFLKNNLGLHRLFNESLRAYSSYQMFPKEVKP